MGNTTFIINMGSNRGAIGIIRFNIIEVKNNTMKTPVILIIFMMSAVFLFIIQSAENIEKFVAQQYTDQQRREFIEIHGTIDDEDDCWCPDDCK